MMAQIAEELQEVPLPAPRPSASTPRPRKPARRGSAMRAPAGRPQLLRAASLPGARVTTAGRVGPCRVSFGMKRQGTRARHRGAR